MSFQDKLNNVDYSFKDYTPSTEALMFINFIKEVNGGSEENKTPLAHAVWLDAIFSKKKRLVAVCHRGWGKTTLSAEYLFLYLACFNRLGSFGDIEFAMYVGDTIENGVKNLRKNIEARYAQSKFLQQMIPNNAIRLLGSSKEGTFDLDKESTGFDSGRKFTDVRIEFINVNKRPFVVRGYGANVGIRGTKELGKRPQLCVIDDILSDEDARSDTVITHLEDIVYKAVAKALHPTKQKIIWLGTPFNSKDPLYKAVESDTWDSYLFPVCEKFPCTKEDFKGCWEERFPYEYVLENYAEAKAVGRPEHFYQELMLQIIPDTDLLVPRDKVIYLDNEELKKPINKYNYYITTDFSFTEKKSSDFSVISVWAVTHNNDYILVEGVCKRQTIDLTINQIMLLAHKYRPLGVGIEVTGQQSGFVNWIKQEQVRTNIFFNIKEIRPSKDKFSRFLEITPFFERGKIIFSKFISEEYKDELADELSKATRKGFKSKHDDILDTISQLSYMECFAPSEIEVEEQEYLDSELEPYDRYPDGNISPIRHLIF